MLQVKPGTPYTLKVPPQQEEEVIIDDEIAMNMIIIYKFGTLQHLASILVWLARPSHLITGALRAGRDSLATVTISSHLFSTNQMLLAGIPANSIRSLRELSHTCYAFQWQWISGLRWSHQTRRGLQWAREITRSFQA